MNFLVHWFIDAVGLGSPTYRYGVGFYGFRSTQPTPSPSNKDRSDLSQ